MAIRSAEGNYRINNLRYGEDDQGKYISLLCQMREGAYAICISPIQLDRGALASLSENEIQAIHNGATIDKGRFRINGVRKVAFHAQPVYRDFDIEPPGYLYVFSVTNNAYNGRFYMDVPDNLHTQEVIVPLEYRVNKRIQSDRGMRFCILSVEIEDTRGYSDGALAYRVGDSLAIPIPKDYISKDLRIRLRAEDKLESVIVDVDPGFAHKYIKIERG